MKTNTIIKGTYAFYMGFALSLFFDAGLTDWRWWAIAIPSMLVMELLTSKNEENESI